MQSIATKLQIVDKTFIVDRNEFWEAFEKVEPITDGKISTKELFKKLVRGFEGSEKYEIVYIYRNRAYQELEVRLIRVEEDDVEKAFRLPSFGYKELTMACDKWGKDITIRWSRDENDLKIICNYIESIEFHKITKLRVKHSNFSLYFSLKPDLTALSRIAKKRILPFTLRLLGYACDDLKDIFFRIFNLLAEKMYIWKDILSDLNEVPEIEEETCPYLSFNNICKSHNRKELLQRTFKREIPDSFNKKNLLVSYSILSAVKKFPGIDEKRLFSLTLNDFGESFDENSALYRYYYKVFEGQSPAFDILSDYLRLCTELGRVPDLNFKSYKALKRRHDEYAEEQWVMAAGEIKIYKNNPFNKLRLPEKYERITTIERLVEEGRTQHNCVALYARDIEGGYCGIYSLLEDNKRYTIEILIDDNKYIINQFYGAYNKEAPQSLVTELENILKGGA